MKEIILELIKLAKDKGLGEVCLLVSILAMLLGLANSAGFHPLDFSKGLVKDIHAASTKENE